jgi:hypothetical protein
VGYQDAPNTVSISSKDERPRGPLVLRSVTMNFADNGGVTVNCRHEPKDTDRYGIGGGKSEEHAYSNAEEALDYVNSLVSPQGEGDESKPDGDEPAAMPASDEPA